MSSSSNTADTVVGDQPAVLDRRRLLAAPVRVDICGRSHRGKVRPNNEDHFFVARFGRFLERLFSNLPENALPTLFEETGYGAIVADGIGGSEAGEVASSLAISTLVNLVLGTPDWIMRLDDDSLQNEVRQRMLQRYDQISETLAEQARADPSLRGFGTTMTMAVSLGRDLFVVHIGDSRAYLLRQRKLHQLTRDHTLAQALAEHGTIIQKDVATHRLRHVLTKSLGAKGGHVEPEIEEVVLEDGDLLLLCTDGLTEMVEERKIAQALLDEETAEKACQRLVEEALSAGGKDNVTVVVARYALPQST
jgi:serine/threonine protein phosphatase PrpC